MENAGEQGKGKTLPVDAFKVCAERGPWGRECPQRNLRQVSQAETQSVQLAVEVAKFHSLFCLQQQR